MGVHAHDGLTWVPGDGTCCWAATTGHGCNGQAVRVSWREDIIDANPLPRAGIVAVPVCAEHGTGSRDWTLIEDREAWLDLLECNQGRVWLVEALSPVR